MKRKKGGLGGCLWFVLVMLGRIGGDGGLIVSILALGLRGLFVGGLWWSLVGGRWGSSGGIGGGLGFGRWSGLGWGLSWFFCGGFVVVVGYVLEYCIVLDRDIFFSWFVWYSSMLLGLCGTVYTVVWEA